jgi:class I fructose-bisphosphate aldolase
MKPALKTVETMNLTPTVKSILSKYEGETPAVKESLARMLMQGRLGGTGQMIILPVDQGFEHGPARSFAMNDAGYDPHYFYELGIAADLNAYAAPLGALEAGVDTFAGKIPLILKMNHGNSLLSNKTNPDQAVVCSVKDAVRLGCTAIGFTLYNGSESYNAQMEELRDIIAEARSHGIASVVWCYPRGGVLPKEAETAVDVVAYAAHMACQLGSHIIKVKLPTDVVWLEAAKKAYTEQKIPVATLADRVRHITKACFNGRRMVVFSGGEAKDTASILDEMRAIKAGGGNGSIMGRNAFQRPRAEAIKLFDSMIDILKN